MKPILLVLALTSPLLLVARHGEAGMRSQSASCSKFSSGAGACSGTFLGFRNHADPDAYADFHTSFLSFPLVVPGFTARLNGVSYSCVFTAEQVATSLPMALAARGSFQVIWDSTGVCQFVAFANASWDSSF
jgi:hypothetical protein